MTDRTTTPAITPDLASASASAVDPQQAGAWDVVHEWHHSLFTGIVLALVTRKGTDVASRTIYEVFARQRLAKFLPGLRRLGLERLPHADAAARYHYLSNNIGGVSVEYMPESDRKAWIRYRAPRWIWSGTALCGIPTEVSRAMLEGWHAQNGVSLKNPRLGFVCTKQTTDGQSSLEGYYYEYDHDLAPGERLQFARHEHGPDFDPALAPTLPEASWPEERILRARRNYAMEYVRTLLPAAIDVLGPGEAAGLLTLAACQVAIQHYHQAYRGLLHEEPDGTIEGFTRFMAALAGATGDELTIEPGTNDRPWTVRQHGWRLFPSANVHRAVVDIWNSTLEGAALAHDPRLELKLLDLTVPEKNHQPCFTWTIRRLGAPVR